MAWQAYLDEYEKLVTDAPRVVIDNAVCPTATLVKVDSARKHGILLEAVQALTDLNLSVEKAYISSDGRWFMDVFHVTDRFGRKLTDDSVVSYLEQSLGMEEEEDDLDRPGEEDEGRLTVLELTGRDRPGLLSEVFAVLADLGCAVAEAKVWTHVGRIACVVSVKDELSGGRDGERIQIVESRLRHVLEGDHGFFCSARTAVASMALAHSDRRLHQMMSADHDYDRADPSPLPASTAAPSVSVQNWAEREYSVVTVQCGDRPRLLFDIVCTLTDMEYVVFHGTIDTDGDSAHQEFYIRHKGGSPISSEAERQRVIRCVQAAIKRRAPEGQRLELLMADRPGLLSEVTRTFRENGLLITGAEVSTKGEIASNVFYVMDVSGRGPDLDAIDAVRRWVGPDCLSEKEEQKPQFRRKAAADDAIRGGGIGFFSLGNLFRRNLYNLGVIKSCS